MNTLFYHKWYSSMQQRDRNKIINTIYCFLTCIIKLIVKVRNFIMNHTQNTAFCNLATCVLKNHLYASSCIQT